MDKPSPTQEDRSRQRSAPSVSLWMLSGLWLEMLASIIGLGLLGYGIDRWVGSFPWVTIVGTVLGVIGGLYNAVKKAMGITSPVKKKNDTRDTPQR